MTPSTTMRHMLNNLVIKLCGAYRPLMYQKTLILQALICDSKENPMNKHLILHILYFSDTAIIFLYTSNNHTAYHTHAHLQGLGKTQMTGILIKNKMYLTFIANTLWVSSKGSCSYFTATNSKSPFKVADCVSESESGSVFIALIT
jgi:disulfide bond formation protein DsbB